MRERKKTPLQLHTGNGDDEDTADVRGFNATAVCSKMEQSPLLASLVLRVSMGTAPKDQPRRAACVASASM